jgi:hypothetical protein
MPLESRPVLDYAPPPPPVRLTRPADARAILLCLLAGAAIALFLYLLVG